MTETLRDFVAPLRTLDPADPDYGHFGPIAAAIGDARIACIGEGQHGAPEFYQLKDRLFRYLVTEHGFTAFVLESGFPEGLRVNEWVQGGAGDLDELSYNGITYGLGCCDEMRAQLQWMRDWNAAHDRKLRFYGLDVGGSMVDPHASVAACLARLPAEPGDAQLLAQTNMGERYVATARWAGMQEWEKSALVEAIALLVERAEKSGDEIALRCARSAALIVGDGRRFAPDSGVNLRDDYMADTVRWIVEREERILIAAHNGHLQRTPVFGNPSFGQFLAQTHEAVVIAATAATGQQILVEMSVSDDGIPRFDDMVGAALEPSAGSINAVLHDQAGALGFVDLRPLPADLLSGEWPMMLQDQTFPIELRNAFDAIVHIDRITVSEELLAAARAAIRGARPGAAAENEGAG